jgi:hypothetical protein
MRDLMRDWRKWSPAERLAVLLVAAVLTGFVPAALALAIHDSPVAVAHHAAED